MFCCTLLSVHPSFAIILIREERAGCFVLIVFLVSRDCCVALPHDSTGLSTVFDRGIFLSYSLFLQLFWWGKERWLLCFICLTECCVVVPRGATGLSAVCDCGISWPDSLLICVQSVCKGFQHWNSPILFEGLLNSVFCFYTHFTRIFCKQTLDSLIRCRVMWRLVLICTVCLCPTKKDFRLIWVNLCFRCSDVAFFGEITALILFIFYIIFHTRTNANLFFKFHFDEKKILFCERWYIWVTTTYVLAEK